MAQLPPKIPNMAQNWPSFPHQKSPSMATSFINSSTNANMGMASQNQHPSWVDEFLDFSSTKRGAHRRSASDPIAFFEAPMLVNEECRNNNNEDDHDIDIDTTNNSAGNYDSAIQGFDRMDDDQLMSMFSDDISMTVQPMATTSSPSTPSDQNSNNDEKVNAHQASDHQQLQPQVLKHEPGEVESSSCSKSEGGLQTMSQQQHGFAPTTSNGDSFLDPKRVKRILANRQSAQRSRVRKLQYISELERSVTSLQSEVSVLSPRVAFLDHQRLILNVDNSALKQRIAALAQDKIFKDAHQEALKKEIERLRQLYHHQNLKKMSNNGQESQNNNDNNINMEKKQVTSSSTSHQQHQLAMERERDLMNNERFVVQSANNQLGAFT